MLDGADVFTVSEVDFSGGFSWLWAGKPEHARKSKAGHVMRMPLD